MADDFDPSSAPLGTPDPRVRDLNSRNLDRAMNSDDEEWSDRFGQRRPTLLATQNRVNEMLIAGGRIFDSEAQGRAAVQDGQYYYVVSADGNISRSIYKRVSSSVSEFVKDEPSAPLVFQNERTGKGARYLIHGDLTQKRFDASQNAWIISHGELLILRGPGRGPIYVEPALNVTIPSASLYYVDLNEVSPSDRVSARVTEGNSNSMANGLGAFVEDLKINLFSNRTQGPTGVLASRYKEVPEYLAVNLIWYPIGSGTRIAYDPASRTLSWSARIVGINRMESINRNAIVLEAHSVVIPGGNYMAVWLDMREVGDGAIDVTQAIRVGSYQGSDPQAFRGLPYQIPLFVSGARGVRPAPGFFENDIEGIYYPADTFAIAQEVAEIDSRVTSLENQDGGAGEPDFSSAADPVYLESGRIMASGIDGERVVSDISPDAYTIAPQWRGKGILTASNRPSAGTTTPVLVSPDGAIYHPSSPELMGVIIGHGQSNSRGNRGYIGDFINLNRRYRDHALMFDGPGEGDREMDVRLGLMPEDFEEPLPRNALTGFKPLKSVDKTGMGTTFMEGGAAQLHASLDRQLSLLADYVYFTAGRGGTALSGLQEGTVPFQNFVTALERAKELAEALGKRLWVPAIWWMQGESNVGTADYMQQLHDNVYQPMVAEIRRITGQLYDPQMFYMQPSSFGNTSAAVKDMFNNADTYSGLHLVGASYPCPFSFDYLHQDRVGQFKIGEYMARATKQVCFGKGTWRPLRPKAVSLETSTRVRVTFDVPVGRLTVDQEKTAKDGNWGFELRNGSTNVPISNVSLSGDAVIITASSPLTSGSSSVRYALNGQTSPRTEEGVPRGLLRDSEPERSLADGSPLYNWCVHFEEPLQ